MSTPYWQSPDGQYTLYCGDALTVLKELPTASVASIVTDPPYGHNNNNGDLIHRWEAALGRGKHGEARAIVNDGPLAHHLYRDILPLLYALLRPGGCCCCCCAGGGGSDPQFARWALWMDEVFRFKQMVVWDKGPMGMGWHYRRSYEVVLIGEKPGAPCAWYGGHTIENIIRPGAYGITKIIPSAQEHPTAKPIALYQHFIQLHSQPDELVLDPFAGESPCGIACIRTGRRFIGIEIDETYCARAVQRLEAELRQPSLPLSMSVVASIQCPLFS